MSTPGAAMDAINADGETDFNYHIDRSLLGRDLARAVRPLTADPATTDFVQGQLDHRHRWPRWLARSVLRPFMSDFAVNGLLDTYRLHLLSTEQWRVVCGGRLGGRLLDVGAGAGNVTRELAPLVDDVVAIETAAALVRRLHEAGFTAHRLDVTTTAIPEAPFDVIALLNVLDRCARPITMLDRLRDALVDGGRLLVSMPLPYQPMHYRGPRHAAPSEPLPIGRGPWERQARDLVELVLQPAGFQVEALSRAPYLSEGDRHVPFYDLDAVIVVCRACARRPRG